jgi:hypothetical protein
MRRGRAFGPACLPALLGRVADTGVSLMDGLSLRQDPGVATANFYSVIGK